MRMIPVQSRDGSWTMPLPEEGIYDNNGNLFHHVHMVALMPVHIERLAEHGIFVEKKRFSKAEDDIIRENWEKFRKEHGLGKDDILPLIGYGKGNHYSRADCEFRKTSSFWLKMCTGLPTRSAHAVKMRVILILDPFRNMPNCEVFTEEEETLLLQLRKKYSYFDISKIMQKSYRGMFNCVQNMMHRLRFSHSERRVLWNTVFYSAKQLFEKVESYKFPSLSKIKWATISVNMSRPKEVLKKEWLLMVEELLELKKSGIPFMDALDKVAPECSFVNAAEMSEFVEIVLEKSVHLDSLHLNEYRATISDTMKVRGLTGFRTGRFSEYYFCLRRLGRMLSALRRHLLRPASLRLSLFTQLQLLSRCLRSLPSAQERKRFQLRRDHVIRKIESLLSTEDPSWEMSGKLRRYIESEEREKKEK